MTQTTVDRVALVRKMYDCFSRGDLDTLRKDVFAPDIVWIMPGRNPIGGTMRGADQVIAFFQQLTRVGIQADILGLDEFGQDTVVEVHHGHTQQPVNGVMYDTIISAHYQIVNGKIARIQSYMTDQYSVDTFFWAAFQLKPLPDRLVQ